MTLVRLLVLATLLAIVASLGAALCQLTTRQGDSGRMMRALSWRVSLSVALFALLLLAARRGWIVPHGIGR